MNWLIPTYYYNTEYKILKCINCGTEIIINQNITSKYGKIKPINLDHSVHKCHGFTQKRSGKS